MRVNITNFMLNAHYTYCRYFARRRCFASCDCLLQPRHYRMPPHACPLSARYMRRDDELFIFYTATKRQSDMILMPIYADNMRAYAGHTYGDAAFSLRFLLFAFYAVQWIIDDFDTLVSLPLMLLLIILSDDGNQLVSTFVTLEAVIR